MKITKRQLRRIIREAVRDLVPSDPRRPGGSYSDIGTDAYSDVIVMSPNGDAVLVDGQETYIEDVPKQLEIVSGFPMKSNDADNLIFALETQRDHDGYIEIEVSYKNGQWSW